MASKPKTRDQLDAEIATLQARIDRERKENAAMRKAFAILDPLWEQHPDLTFGEVKQLYVDLHGPCAALDAMPAVIRLPSQEQTNK